MKTHSGIPSISPSERKALVILIGHAKRDLGFMEGGSYGDGEKLYKAEHKAGTRAVEMLEWMLECVL